MKYSKTAMIYVDNSGRVARTFVSDKEITDEEIMDTLGLAHDTPLSVLQIVDTPEPEELNRIIKVCVGQFCDALYMGLKINDSWGNFYRIPENLNGPGIITTIRLIQKTGRLPEDIGWGCVWSCGRKALNIVVTHDGDQLIFHMGQMNDRTKRLLRVL